MKTCLRLPVLFAFAAAAVGLTAAPVTRIAIDATAPGLAVAPTLHGLFYEDINYAGDGGLYAELVQNRSFEHEAALHAWTILARGGAQGENSLATTAPLHPNNPRYLRLTVTTPGTGDTAGYGVANDGFGGVAVRGGESYFARVRARTHVGATTFAGALVAQLEASDGRVLAAAPLGTPGERWAELEVKLTPTATADHARLVILARGTGTVDLDVVSLFPEKTFRGHRNGLRADLAQAFADLKPGFLRFPGGCIVEGNGLANAYRWKDTIGDIAERKQNWNLWKDGRSPHYYQTYGLGFFEYFQFAEDIGAAPVPVVNCGMACQARGGVCVPMEELGPWIQDALDLVEFANGPVTSEWGGRRAAMGHPAPLGLKYLAVGNEQWHQDYFDRYDVFHRAIKAKHPEIEIISTSGPFADDPLWQFAWNKFRTGTPADIVDEHYYVAPSWLYANVDRYARYDRKGPKVFVGEFAAHLPNRRNTLGSALAEAAYMTGLLRHADVVVMASYAPLLAKVGHTQWQPDLIWFDNTRRLLTPNYHAQAIFSQNVPAQVLPTRIEGTAPVVAPRYAGRIGLGTWLTQAEFKDIKVTAADGRELYRSDFSSGRGREGWTFEAGQWVVVDGALRQTSEEPNQSAMFGDSNWSDYTLTLRARSLAGREGFLVFFGGGDGTARWNLGGWANQEHGLDVPGAGVVRIPGTIEPRRWYDVRIELRGATVKCYLNGKLLQQAEQQARPALYAVAGRLADGGTVIQVVNTAAEPVTTIVALTGLGAGALAPEATVIELGGDPAAENTFDAPDAIAPRTRTVAVAGPEFEHTFPAHTATTLRLPAKR